MSRNCSSLAIGILVACLSTGAHTDTAQTAFDQGIKAFREQKYSEAVAAFESAKKQGLTAAVIDFNLGVSYYKLRAYTRAEAALQSASRDKKIRQLSHYNLGLVYLKKHETDNAMAMFRKATTNQDNPEVTALAKKMLDQHAADARVTPAKLSVTGLVSLAYGHDDNVVATASTIPSNVADNYFSTFAFVNVPLRHITLNANLLVHDYNQYNAEDLARYSAGILVPFTRGRWHLTPSVHLAKSTLNSADLQDTIDFRLAAKIRLENAAQLAFRFTYSDIDSSNAAYTYLNGDRQQYRIDYTTQTGAGNVRLRYELETNHRQNTPTVNYSPTRHTLRLRLTRPLFGDTGIKAELAYRDSQYEAAGGITRNDKRTQFRLDLYQPITHEWRAGLRYVHTDNDSNLPVETYTRNDVQFYLDWTF